MKKIEDELKERLGKHLGGGVRLEVPSDPEHGDYATNACIREAKEKDGEPRGLAEKTVEKMNTDDMDVVERIDVAGPGFINFFLDREEYAKLLLEEIVEEGGGYGGLDIGEGTVVIDYSHPNIGKPMHVGHLRSTIIGDSLYRILEFVGYNCVGINHLGDMGTQFGKLMYAYRNWGDEEKLEEDPIQHLLELYIKFHDEEDEELENRAREWSKRLEDGDEEAIGLWKEFTDYSKKKLEEIYDRLNVSFDSWKGEWFFREMAGDIVDEAIEKGVAERDEDGSVVIKFEEDDLPPYPIMRSDGGTLYSTRDIAAVKYRKDEYGFHRCIYVVGSDQRLHFRQLFRSVDMLGYADEDELVHANFGMMQLPGGNMSTRRGEVVLLEDVMDTARDKAMKAIKEKNPDLEDKEKTAEKVGIGAIKYFDLSKNRKTDASFSWEEALSFEGSSGPYLQYSYARACGILDKVESVGDPDFGEIKDIEFELVKKMGRFHHYVENAARNYEPHRIANYLNELCETFNEFYHECRVKDSDYEARRREMVHAFRTVLGNGMRLLNIPRLEEM